VTFVKFIFTFVKWILLQTFTDVNTQFTKFNAYALQFLYYNMDMQKAVEAIAEWMEKEGVSQNQLARKTGYSPGLVSLILSRQRSATVEFIGKASEALGHSKEEILRIAEFLPEDDDIDSWAENMKHILKQYPPELRDPIETIIKGLYRKQQRDKEKKRRKS
jgi:transcriptional regulator with XRE-family HTH domain